MGLGNSYCDQLNQGNKDSEKLKQIDQFANSLSKTMIDAYASYMDRYKNYNFRIQRSIDYQRSSVPKARVYVLMQNKQSAESAQLIYLLSYNTKKQSWLLENVAVAGINLGRLFRNQFSELKKQNNDDTQKTIAAWEKSFKNKNTKITAANG
jgi:phospholipid transport system substrate-binding protein